VKPGVKTQRSIAVNVATSRGNSKGFTAASSQDPETNLFDSVESTKVKARNNMSNLIVELRVIVPATPNVNNAKTSVVTTRGSVGKSMNGHKTTFTSSNSPSHWGGGANKGVGGGNRVTHRESSPVAKGQASHQRRMRGGSIHQPEGEANKRSETVMFTCSEGQASHRRQKQHNSPPEGKATPDARRQSNTTGNEAKDFVNYREGGKSI